MHRYYSTERPVEPGAFPKPRNNKVCGIWNYDGKQYVPEINAEAWGFVEYKEPLSAEDAEAYELIGAKI